MVMRIAPRRFRFRRKHNIRTRNGKFSGPLVLDIYRRSGTFMFSARPLFSYKTGQELNIKTYTVHYIMHLIKTALLLCKAVYAVFTQKRIKY